MYYKGYKIQINNSDVAIIDKDGKFIARVETEEAAIEWINENK